MVESVIRSTAWTVVLLATPLAVLPGVASAEERPGERISVRLSPGPYDHGRQWLRVSVYNRSRDLSAMFEPGGIPTEILVDGVAYRSTRVAKSGQRPWVVKPNSKTYGKAFTPYQDWVATHGPEGVGLKPGKHTVRAVVYATGEANADGKVEDDGRQARLVSNAIELGAGGRAPGLLGVRFRMLGGEAKKPLADLDLTVRFAGKEIRRTTEADGGASFDLAPGMYDLSFTSPRPLPYLRFDRMDYEYRRSKWRSIHLNDKPAEQTIDLVLADPCELVFRAVDVDTGEGIAGVGFAMENLAGEVWAAPILNDTIEPAPKAGKRAKSDAGEESELTDEQGYFRRLRGPWHEKWTYFVDVWPDGYHRASHVEVKIDTSLGKRRAEHTFLFRRKEEGTLSDAARGARIKRMFNVTPPEGWRAVDPKFPFIRAEFELPKAEGDGQDGRLTVVTAGGSANTNIQRWRGQFQDLKDELVEEVDVSGTKVTLVDFRGTYRGTPGPVAERTGTRMLGAIISKPDGLWFVKGYGPDQTMARHAEAFRAFAEKLASVGEED